MNRPAGERTVLAAIARRMAEERGFAPVPPPPVFAELARVTAGPPPENGLADLTGLPWCSIDNDESRDLDQLTVAREDGPDGTTLLVAVADVDQRVAAGGAIDAHAAHNTVSIYTPAVVFPMLPERLSTDLTSLNPHEDRVALVTELAVDPEGAVTASRVFRARVRSHARLAYGEVARWLDGAGRVPAELAAVPGLDRNLRAQEAAAQRLGVHRQENGALEFESVEARFEWMGDALRDLVPARRNRAKEMIENLMIAVNVATAQFLERHGLPSLRRVVRAPRRWDRIVALAAGRGHALPPAPDPRALQRFLRAERRRDPLRFPDLSLSVVKLLGSGEYVLDRAGEEGPGHFGLAVPDYAHSTAPNRRYADLVTHRLVKAVLAGATVPYTEDRLAELARHCTRREDDAGKVERQVKKSAAALLLEGRTGQAFEAIVTGAAAKGTWVRLANPPVEGRVVRGAEGLDVGDRVTVRLVRTDIEQGFIDLAADRVAGPA